MGRTNPILHTQGRNFRIRSSGYLPHWELDDAIYSITIRLADSIPFTVLQTLGAERRRFLDRATTFVERAQVDRAFELRLDVYADEGHGAKLLARPGVASMVMGAVQHFNGSRYTLHAVAVMPNHAHVLTHLEQGQDLSRTVHSWKWFTAATANRMLGREGPFWQRGYFDRIVRDPGDYETTRRYILDNPMKAGLRDWPWIWPW
jgi:type I restriction enzyme R subunit/putative DNA methylase